ncbi:RagB/SusD family nutrient uptake outer membrane protein [Arenibacter sp. S6351L]|uniref:RagB/SusD family nutrient uptake outer membrane protein n=1 Tax=Arenibacter sp. S6351L TaxID=2926407 RepID=UPI001FF4177E|nr:RagB/SusD family nutrient uptake outer membrane protein [Arenibacter sp. S6351L]MCK0137019.1 RagB/SusD family nutrient uptake outer membrane protein [Arenibacter sp. S6351L]
MKKYIKTFFLLICISGLFMAFGCESILEEENKSQLSPDNLLNSELGITTVIANAYSVLNDLISSRNHVKREEMTTDILWQTGGGENGTAVSLIGFLWDSNATLEAFDWGRYWNVIRDANTVLDNIENVGDIDDAKKQGLIAEARFLRVQAYYMLYIQYGTLPIRTSLSDPQQLARSSDEEFKTFMETEFLAAISNLPSPGKELNYGRVNTGGAKGLLCKWYLNTKQWQKCLDIANDIIDDGTYSLYPSYFDLFALENKHNSEFMLVRTSLANEPNSVNFIATGLPPGYKVGLDGGMENAVNNTWSNFASQYRLYDEFYNSFEDGDTRNSRILTRYIQGNGNEVNLLATPNNTRAVKYPPDPATQGERHGNDFPIVRYADILLSKAEVLNELNGPNQESVDYINMIRNRAGLEDKLLSDFPTKDSLRDHILDERRWEFWYEGHRRTDLLRMGKFIESAIGRGYSAQEKHKLFPIPQGEIDANLLMVQNPGY